MTEPLWINDVVRIKVIAVKATKQKTSNGEYKHYKELRLKYLKAIRENTRLKVQLSKHGSSPRRKMEYDYDNNPHFNKSLDDEVEEMQQLFDNYETD